jgi:hypothetical protein
MEIPEGDEHCYLNHLEIEKLEGLLLEQSNLMLPSKELLKRIKNLEAKIKKITRLPTNLTNKPFNKLEFEHQLIVLMHFYHKFSGCKMDKKLKKYIIDVKYTHHVERYKILNLKKLSDRKSCTIELRAKHGSNDAIEMANFCILIEKLVNVAEKMVLHKDIPLLKSLASILNVSESELLAFKSIEPKDLSANYESQKHLLKHILNGLYKNSDGSVDTVCITYWQKQLRRINGHKDPKRPKGSLNSLSSSASKSSARKNTL